jgi:hypothetical protein
VLVQGDQQLIRLFLVSPNSVLLRENQTLVNERLVTEDPTILALRRALDGHAAALERGDFSRQLPNLILSCLQLDICNTIFLPADGTRGPHLAISFKPALRRYVTFAAEYWAALIHRDTPVERINPDQRIARMRTTFEKDKSLLADDYAYFTTPRESIHPNKVAHRSAERSERQSPEPSEKQSSDKSDD